MLTGCSNFAMHVRGLIRRPAYTGGHHRDAGARHRCDRRVVRRDQRDAVPAHSAEERREHRQRVSDAAGHDRRGKRNPLHAIDLVRLRKRSRTLTHIAAFTTADRVLGAGPEPAVVNTSPVNAELLRLSIEGPPAGPDLHR